jgi:hypothetical protein
LLKESIVIDVDDIKEERDRFKQMAKNIDFEKTIDEWYETRLRVRILEEIAGIILIVFAVNSLLTMDSILRGLIVFSLLSILGFLALSDMLYKRRKDKHYKIDNVTLYFKSKHVIYNNNGETMIIPKSR